MSDYLIDSHCHLHDQEWFQPAEAKAFLREAAEQNVRQIIVIGTDPEDSVNACDFAATHPNVFWTYGIHPESAGRTDFDFSTIKASLQDTPNRPVAIGEIGLDYHYEGYNREAQIQLFEQMLQLAQDLDLPVSLHLREAFSDAWAVLGNFPRLRGVVHSFTGNKKELKVALARDLYIGVNGLVTYTTPPLPPLERIVLETDAPFLTPVPFRGTINKPAYVRNIATYLAGKMGVAEVNLVEQTTKNARQLFQLTGLKPVPGV